MAGKIEFSEKALKSRNAGQQNYSLTSVKARWTWFILMSVTLLFAGLTVWGFCGSMVETVTGTGITVMRKGVYPITATGTGQLVDLNVQPGAQVSAGQPVGEIHDPQVFFNIRKLESEYNLLCKEVEFLKNGIDRLTQRKVGLDKKRESMLTDLSRKQEDSKQRAEEIAKRYAGLAEAGAASKVSLYQMLDSALQTETSLFSTRVQLMEAEVSQQDLIWQLEQRLLELNQQLEQKLRDLELARKLYQESRWLTTDFGGEVLEVFKKQGEFVQNGERLGLVASDMNGGMYLVAYVPVVLGPNIRNGMSAYFAPTIAPSARFGYIKCVVREVSNAPVNPESVQTELSNSVLVQALASQGPTMRVVLEMLPDANSVSGYLWTSKDGYKGKIGNGAMGQVIINTSHRAPASYVIPALRELLAHDSQAEKPEDSKEKKK